MANERGAARERGGGRGTGEETEEVRGVKLIQQPNSWTCAAACVCMITGTTLADFYEFCGHDGSEQVQVTPARWMGVRCFDMKELIRYLMEYDKFLGCGGQGIHVDFNPLAELLTVGFDWEKQDFLIDVKSGSYTEGVHQILWSHKLMRIVDPLFPEAGKTFTDYEIIGWWPVVKAFGAMS